MDNKHTEVEFDAIIIGVGQAGNPLAARLASKGWRTAVVERSFAGGTCINYGCTPTKTMIASARVAYQCRRAAEYGIQAGGIKVAMAKVRSRKDAMVKMFREGVEKSLNDTKNLELIYGEARFLEQNRLSVSLRKGGTRVIKGKKIFINTGARPEIPEIEGLNSIDYLDSTSIMDLTEVPEHLIIIGGGYIGLEFGQMFRRFGSTVTIIERSDQIASKEDPDVSEALQKIFQEDHIEVLCGSTVQTVSKEDDRVRVKIRRGGDQMTIQGSHLLMASGRTPNTEALDLEKAGIEVDENKYIKVNERLETTGEGIYALGDVKKGPAFTHVSYDDYRIVAGNVLDSENKTTTGRYIPYCVFTDPQLGRVGLTEKQAREKGYPVKIARMPMEKAARALETGETRGLMKVVIDDHTGQILGAAILGPEGGELMSVLQIAMMAKMPYTDIRDGIFAHPTLTESLNNLFMQGIQD